jgi:hypothetical protein
MSRAIIEGTRFPYTENDLTNWSFDSNIGFLVKIARDADVLGIIGIENDREREQALIGFARELLRKHSPKELLATHIQNTNIFFDSLHLYTIWAQHWADENLENMRQWQLGFMPRAIEIASQD